MTYFIYDGWTKRSSAKMVCAERMPDHKGGLTSRVPYGRRGNNMVAELQMDLDTGTLELGQSYLWGRDLSGSMQGAGGVGGLLAVLDHTNGTDVHFAISDANGNVSALVDGSDGTLTAEYGYGPFGEPTKTIGPMAKKNPFRFSTKYTDDETGLVYYGFRYFLPELGRWLNRDPIGEWGGVNLYGFVGNDPVNVWDYLGLDFIAVGSRPLASRLLGWRYGHYSISYWKGCCPEAETGKEYTVTELLRLCPDLEKEAGVELLRSDGWNARVNRRVFPGTRTISVNVSYITYDESATDVIPIFQDDDPAEVERKWNEVIGHAQSYGYAEQDGFASGPTFRNWPSSRYYAPSGSIQNNSNVFARYIVEQSRLRMYEISARVHPPEGQSRPVPVDDHDYVGVPFR